MKLKSDKIQENDLGLKLMNYIIEENIPIKNGIKKYKLSYSTVIKYINNIKTRDPELYEEYKKIKNKQDRIRAMYKSDELTKDLGYYTRATGYSNLPSTTVTGILASVAFPVLCDIQGDNERLQGAYRKLLRLSAFVVFPIMIGLAALARPLILVMITAKWEPSVVYLQILCFALMWYPIHALNLNLLQVKGRSDLFLRLEIIKKIIGVSIIFIVSSFGVLAMCVGSVISSLLCLFLNTYYTGKFINLSFWYQMKDLIPSLFYSLSMGGLIWVISLFIPYNGIKLLVCIP